ncbi:MAG: alanine--glyoxylate aminotransferase family protein, partial [Deltaproteobacteria bacterium]|nr:alanine--glyoxylate aminotransferase family protein [Deltaproteobacteria bacterium]
MVLEGVGERNRLVVALDLLDWTQKALGLGQVPLSPAIAAHTMTAPRFPAGIGAADLLPKVTTAGVMLAAGLHPAIRAEYFRIGHMGVVTQGDLL